jgi:hypothetical protein
MSGTHSTFYWFIVGEIAAIILALCLAYTPRSHP